MTSVGKILRKLKNGISHDSKTVKQFGSTLIHGRSNYDPDVRKLLEKVGDETIEQIEVIRTPITAELIKILKALNGHFGKSLESKPYDQLFHLGILFKIHSGVLMVEKNEVITMTLNPSIASNAEVHQIQSVEVSVNQFLSNGENYMGKQRYFDYNAWKNNCQDYIVGLLKGNNIATDQDVAFVKQDTDSLFRKQTGFKKFLNFSTEAGERFNILTKGRGISNNNEINQCNHLKSSMDSINTMAPPSRQIGGCGLSLFGGSIGDQCDSEMTAWGRGFRVEDKGTEGCWGRGMSIDDSLAPPSRQIAGGKINFQSLGKRTKRLSNKLSSKTMNFIDNQPDEPMDAIRDTARGVTKQIKNRGLRAYDRYDDDVIGNLKKSEAIATQAGRYVTRKKGGLTSDVITYGLPSATAATLGGLAGLASGGNPIVGVAASAIGSKLGTLAADKIKKETGRGLSNVNEYPRTSDEPVSEYNRGNKRIVSHSYLHNLSSEDLRALSHLQKQQREADGTMDLNKQKTIKLTRQRIDRDLKELHKATKRPSRFKKGSPEALAWGKRMREARLKK